MYSDAVITFHYGTDKNKDQIPDMYQLTIVFEAVNGTFTETDNAKVEKTITLTDNGTAEGSWREDGKYILTASDVPEAKPNPGYTEDSKKWDVPAPLGYTIFKEMGVDDKETDISGTQRTFTVRFDGKQKQTYTVHYIDEDTNLEIAEPQIKDTEFEAYINGNDEKIDIEGYAFTHATDLYVTDDNESNIVNVYYSKDEKGNENDPTKPDGKPDKYQVIFTYRLSDASQGTINGGTQDVYEIRSRAEEDDALAPNAAVTITPADGYRFAHWQDQNGTVYSTTEALKATSFEDDMTFTAYFETTGGEDPDNPGGEDPDNPSTPGGDDNPGGGNGSGSSSGGSGGSSSGGGSPYAPATSGPGVTIDEDAVPLAPLPDGGTSFVIDEDSVPLAPLPKTGQQPIRTQVTMLFAGIFLALASVRKRKEEN